MMLVQYYWFTSPAPGACWGSGQLLLSEVGPLLRRELDRVVRQAAGVGPQQGEGRAGAH